jgi:PqqD family protein of HPr-rel-A system
MHDLSRLRDLAVSDSGFVFDPMTGYTFTVNPTGLLVLQSLKRGDPVESIAQRLADEFELDGGEDVHRDIDEFLARLREHGIVR